MANVKDLLVNGDARVVGNLNGGGGVRGSISKDMVTTALGYTPPTTNTTYSAGTALSLSGTTFNHSNYATAGTAGTSSATSGSSLAVPYVTVNAQGHVTGYGTHTHTVSGFATVNGHTWTTTKGTTSSGASSTNPAVIVTTYRSENSWYRVWSDGWIEQGGTCSKTANWYAKATFPKAFTTTQYTLVSRGNENSSSSYSGNYMTGLQRYTTYANIGTDCPQIWYACGY